MWMHGEGGLDGGMIRCAHVDVCRAMYAVWMYGVLHVDAAHARCIRIHITCAACSLDIRCSACLHALQGELLREAVGVTPLAV